MWLLGVVLRRYIDFLILLIPTPLVSVLCNVVLPNSCVFLCNTDHLISYPVSRFVA